MSESARTYLPAAGHDWSLPLYDPIVKLLGGDKARKVLVDQAALQPGHHVLDIGCGTGTLAVAIKRNHPEVVLVGIDPDPRALARAQRKAAKAGVSIQFDQGFGDKLPYPDSSFDRVISSFMFHHLPPDAKLSVLSEVRRVLKPGGRLHLADFELAGNGPHGFFARLFNSHEHLKDNSADRILNLMTQAGFRDPQKIAERPMFSGRIGYFQAVRE